MENTIDIRDGLSINIRKILSYMIIQLPSDVPFQRSMSIVTKLEELHNIDKYDCYDILVELARKENYLQLIDGHGNFSFFPAAPDFSECRSSRLLQYIYKNRDVSDINTPLAIPLPYLLICGVPDYYNNLTKISQHNLKSVIKAVLCLINNPNATNKELTEIIQGPELYIGGEIINSDELPKIYERGYGEIHYAISRKTLKHECGDGIKDSCNTFCKWYGHKLTKPENAKRGYYEITVQYNAMLTNGKETRYFSIKEILQAFIDNYRSAVLSCSPLTSDNESLCKSLIGDVEKVLSLSCGYHR